MDKILQHIFKLSDNTLVKLEKLGIRSLWDLVLHLPLRYEDETHLTPIADLRVHEHAFVEGTVLLQEVVFKPRRQLVVRIQDKNLSSLILRFIHFYPSQQKQLSEGKTIRALGEVRQGYYGLGMVHPKIKEEHDGALSTQLTPIYPTVSGLTQATLRRLIQKALSALVLSDTLPETVLQQLDLMGLKESLLALHFPSPETSAADLEKHLHPAWQRLKFDELLAQQLAMQLARAARQKQSSMVLKTQGLLTDKLLELLPFDLTAAQERVFSEIKHDLGLSSPMHRLLHGDVGSGKTIIAALSALTAIEAGFQVALMAPTEILAEQHALKCKAWFKDLNIPVIHLSGSMKQKAKNQAIASLNTEEPFLAIGTHALFQKNVVFKRLGLIIVDEQHRFGVSQRLALKNKAISMHQLMMSATPIPRTLAMNYFADLDISIIDELPPNRTPITTKLINALRRDDVESFVYNQILNNEQVYWVCPLIEESEVLQLQTATETHERLQARFPQFNIGLVHGRMKPDEKNAVMAAFVSGDIQLLVATTVIEVGVDVPNASLMLIEHAERMGLSQLHQLRGRVGRGVQKSTCILMFAEPLSLQAKARLKIMYESSDGFEIAREDLKLRGPGDFLGTKQSGIPLFRFADLEEDVAILERARVYSSELLSRSPETVEKHLDRWVAYRENYLSV